MSEDGNDISLSQQKQPTSQEKQPTHVGSVAFSASINSAIARQYHRLKC